jgi:hypothetical protein
LLVGEMLGIEFGDLQIAIYNVEGNSLQRTMDAPTLRRFLRTGSWVTMCWSVRFMKVQVGST